MDMRFLILLPLLLGCEPATGTGVGTAGGLEIAESFGERCALEPADLGIIEPASILSWKVCQQSADKLCYVNSYADIAVGSDGTVTAFCRDINGAAVDIHLYYIANFEGSSGSDSAR